MGNFENNINVQNEANANAQATANSGGSGINIMLGSGGVLVGAGILLAILFFLLGAELFRATLFWTVIFASAVITFYLIARGYGWHKRNTQNEVLRWIQTGASIGLEVQKASIDAQSQLHKAMGGITIETIRTLRSSGALESSQPPLFLPGALTRADDDNNNFIEGNFNVIHGLNDEEGKLQ